METRKTKQAVESKAAEAISASIPKSNAINPVPSVDIRVLVGRIWDALEIQTATGSEIASIIRTALKEMDHEAKAVLVAVHGSENLLVGTLLGENRTSFRTPDEAAAHLRIGVDSVSELQNKGLAAIELNLYLNGITTRHIDDVIASIQRG